jgi:hypothetical protein
MTHEGMQDSQVVRHLKNMFALSLIKKYFIMLHPETTVSENLETQQLSLQQFNN